MSLVSTVHSHSQGTTASAAFTRRSGFPRDKKGNQAVMIEVANADLKGVEQVKLF